MILRDLLTERGQLPMYYFAYGMLTDAKNMPGAEYVGVAELRNHRMEFWHWADVVDSPGDTVQGVLWRLPDGMLKSLDQNEGYPSLYGRKTVPVFADGQRYEATVYYMTPQTHEQIENKKDGRRPARSYLQTMGRGYVAAGISSEQIHQALRDSLDQGKDLDEDIQEVKILTKVKGKGSEPSQLPRFGRPIESGREEYYLGKRVARYNGYHIYRDWFGGQLSYHLFDPRGRTVVLTTFGSQYKGNPNSYIIHGLYAAPSNPVKAHEFYRALIKNLGLTLISDRKQSPGGNRVWQRLENYPDIEVYGYDTHTDQALNISAKDQEMYAVPSAAVKNKETQYIAHNIRLVAAAK